MTVVLDAGALIAIDRGNRELLALLKIEHRHGRVPLTHGGVVGQVWRDGATQANLARALGGIEVRPIDEKLGRQAGSLLRHAHMTDVNDAAIIVIATDDDTILTSDVDDLHRLCTARELSVDLVHV